LRKFSFERQPTQDLALSPGNSVRTKFVVKCTLE
jgi:hypothetical protein